MDKSKIINSYFEAFTTKDIVALNSILSSGFGIRTFLGNLVFDIDEINNLFGIYTITNVDIIALDESKDIVYVNAIVEYAIDKEVLNERIIIKFVIKNNLIIRAYETVEKVGYTRIKCIVSYDGSTFGGFQRQPDIKTVQGEIESALLHLTKEVITIHSSGRTDKGVHAIKQNFHFDTLSKISPIDFARVLRSYLPDSIYLVSSEEVHPTFHSRYDSYSKEYVYKLNINEYDPIQRNYEWYVNGIDVNILRKELNSIIGTYDFTSFTKTKEDKIMTRTIFDVKIDEKDQFIYISIIGSGFLRYMVRYIVGTAIEISKGDLKETLLDYISYKNSSEVKWKAPSAGLYLKEVLFLD